MAYNTYQGGALGSWARRPVAMAGPQTSTVTQGIEGPPAVGTGVDFSQQQDGYANTISTPQSDPHYYEKLKAQTGHDQPIYVDDATRKYLLAQQAGIAGQFADQAQQGYAAYGAQGQSALDYLRGLTQGQNSVSAMQLAQGQQGNLSAARSMAAGASPRDAAMAARTAAIQMGRSNVGLSGQQALAGLQERNQAWQQYGGLLQGLRGQDLNAATAGRQAATAGYGAAPFVPPTNNDAAYLGAIAAGIGYAASDRRLKTDVKDGDAAANKAASKLPAFAFRYKDQRFGEGKQIGPMAQDLERAGLRNTVVDTPGGKVVHGTKLALANTAMLAAMGRRLAKLEGSSK